LGDGLPHPTLCIYQEIRTEESNLLAGGKCFRAQLWYYHSYKEAFVTLLSLKVEREIQNPPGYWILGQNQQFLLYMAFV
jgi:hypothetical protein